jgi:hypothetical protein
MGVGVVRGGAASSWLRAVEFSVRCGCSHEWEHDGRLATFVNSSRRVLAMAERDWSKEAADLSSQVQQLEAGHKAKLLLGTAQVALADAELALIDAERAHSQAKSAPRSVYRAACKALLANAKAVDNAARDIDRLNSSPQSKKLSDATQKALHSADQARRKVGFLFRLGF